MIHTADTDDIYANINQNSGSMKQKVPIDPKWTRNNISEISNRICFALMFDFEMTIYFWHFKSKSASDKFGQLSWVLSSLDEQYSLEY